MEMELSTLTPLWTGGLNGEVDRIHETGVIGSLRWWFELFIRGLGGWVNDPSDDERSIFDARKREESSAHDERGRLRDAGLCDASQVFGATGWRRRFRLTIEDSATSNATILNPIKADQRYKDAKGGTHTPAWRFPSEPKSGCFTVRVESLAPNFPAEVIGGLLQFIADWAALGAKAQMGFGVVEAVSGRFDTRPLYDWLIGTAGSRQDPDLPSLQNLFLARIRLPNATEKDTFNLKYDLRQLFNGGENEDLRHFVMGTVKRGRMAAKVKMSRPYGDGLMRVWGWIPEDGGDAYQGSWDRDTIVDLIHQHLRKQYTLEIWREMKSPRDTVKTDNADAQAFLRDLLDLENNDHAA